MFRGRVKQLISTWQSSSRTRNGIEGWKLCSHPLVLSRRVTSRRPLRKAKANLSSARTSSDAGLCVSHHNSSTSSPIPRADSPIYQPMAAAQIDGCENFWTRKLPSDSVIPLSQRISVEYPRLKPNQLFYSKYYVRYKLKYQLYKKVIFLLC